MEKGTLDRIYARSIASDGGCIVWTGGKNKKGYGSISYKGKTRLVHRLVYESFYGVAEEQCVCHTCDNPACVNPKHLWAGTIEQNNKDKKRKGRASRVTGERHGLHKLSPGSVLEIRDRYSRGGVTQRKLASEYGVSQTTVKDVIHRIIWREV